MRTVSEAEQAKRAQFRRRIVVVRDVRQGERLTAADLDFKRPGTGIGPDELAYVEGRKAAHDLRAECELDWTDLD
ncbi:MAG: SAF domain-containing protein [Thermoleophilia bacterium]